MHGWNEETPPHTPSYVYPWNVTWRVRTVCLDVDLVQYLEHVRFTPARGRGCTSHHEQHKPKQSALHDGERKERHHLTGTRSMTHSPHRSDRHLEGQALR